MITRQTVERLQLLVIRAESNGQAELDELAAALLEECEELIDAAIGYIAMQEQAEALGDDLEREAE